MLCALSPLAEESEPDGLSKVDVEELRTIAKTRHLPKGWRIEAVSQIAGVDGDRFEGWFIQLVRADKAERKPTFRIRQRLLRQVDAVGKTLLPPTVTSIPDHSTPLAAAVNGFNEQHNRAGGVTQQPLTETEVIAAIHWWKSQRNDASVTNREFALFQQIADTRQVPAGTKLEVIPEFRSGRNSRFIWSVRIVMPRESMPGWTYAFLIRQHHIRSVELQSGNDSEREAPIFWGEAAPNGLQVGVRAEPLRLNRHVFAVGQDFTPAFYYRNTGKQTMEISVPRLMTPSYYKKLSAVDAAGKELIIMQTQEPGTPVGWQLVELPPGAEHQVRGLPIRLGFDRGGAATAIRVEAGMSIGVRFELPNLADRDAAALWTGELNFSIVNPSEIMGETPPLPEPEELIGRTVEVQGQRVVNHDVDNDFPSKSILQFHTDYPVKVLACSPDGGLLAVAFDDPTNARDEDWASAVKILGVDVKVPAAKWSLKTISKDNVQSTVECLVFSPDGKMLAVGDSFGEVKLFNSESAKLVRSLDDIPGKQVRVPLKSTKRAMGSIRSLAFSPDGKLLATCGAAFGDVGHSEGGIEDTGSAVTGPGRLKVWSVDDGQLKLDLAEFSSVEAVAFSPDGATLAAVGEWLTENEAGFGVILWNVQTGQKLRTHKSDMSVAKGHANAVDHAHRRLFRQCRNQWPHECGRFLLTAN